MGKEAVTFADGETKAVNARLANNKTRVDLLKKHGYDFVDVAKVDKINAMCAAGLDNPAKESIAKQKKAYGKADFQMDIDNYIDDIKETQDKMEETGLLGQLWNEIGGASLWKWIKDTAYWCNFPLRLYHYFWGGDAVKRKVYADANAQLRSSDTGKFREFLDTKRKENCQRITKSGKALMCNAEGAHYRKLYNHLEGIDGDTKRYLRDYKESGKCYDRNKLDRSTATVADRFLWSNLTWLPGMDLDDDKYKLKGCRPNHGMMRKAQEYVDKLNPDNVPLKDTSGLSAQARTALEKDQLGTLADNLKQCKKDWSNHLS